MLLNCLEGSPLHASRRVVGNLLWALLLVCFSGSWLTGCNDTSSVSPPDTGPGPLRITTTSLPDGTADQPYATTVGGSGGRTDYTWSVTPDLPADLFFDTASGVITGRPAAEGNSTHRFSLSDSSSPPQTAQRSLSLTIKAGLVITTSSLPHGTVNQEYLQTTLQATGGTPPYTWSVNPALPNGVQFNVVSPGTISGIPQAGTSGVTDHTFTVIDSASPFNQTNNRQLSLTINPTVPPLIITFPEEGDALPNGTVDEPYNETLRASGGTPPYTWSVVSQALPAWLELDETTGTLTGTPTTAGNVRRTYTVRDSTLPTNKTARRAISLRITN